MKILGDHQLHTLDNVRSPSPKIAYDDLKIQQERFPVSARPRSSTWHFDLPPPENARLSEKLAPDAALPRVFRPAVPLGIFAGGAFIDV